MQLAKNAARAAKAQLAKHAARAQLQLALQKNDLPTFTVQELRKFDSSDPALPIYMAVGGYVLDVTASSKFYGQGAPRQIYAGRVASRALALQSTSEDDLNDETDDFTAVQLKALQDRIEFFLVKFPKVGVLAA